MDKKQFLATAIAGAAFVVSAVYNAARPSIFNTQPVFTLPKPDNSAERTKGLELLFATDAFKDALPSAQERMIKAVRDTYN